MIICYCLLLWSAHYEARWSDFVRNHIVADDPFDKRRNGPWGRRPEDPAEWNDPIDKPDPYDHDLGK